MFIWCLQIDKNPKNIIVRVSALALKKSSNKKIMALYLTLTLLYYLFDLTFFKRLGQKSLQNFVGFFGRFDTNDLSIASTKTKYIKLNTKTQNIFCRLNENLTTFYTL